jgi:hypothetical protein
MKLKLGCAWAATAAALIAAVLVLLLSHAAHRQVEHATHVVDETALQLMAPVYPTRMCVNGSRDSISTLATTAPLKVCCKDVSGMWMPKKAVTNNVDFDMSLLDELARCGAITSCYFAGEVPGIFFANSHTATNSSNEALWKHSIPTAAAAYNPMSTCNITKIGAIGEMLMRRSSNTNSSFKSTFYLPAAAGQSDAGMVNYHLQVTRYGILASLLDVPVLSGTWRLEFAGGSDILWLHISQTAKTAQCLGKSSHNFCDLDETVANTSTKQPAVLLPSQFVSYRCVDGVDVTYLDTLNTFKGVVRSSATGSLLGIAYYSSDGVYALYTATMGALFGAVAALIGAAAVALALSSVFVFGKCMRRRAMGRSAVQEVEFKHDPAV